MGAVAMMVSALMGFGVGTLLGWELHGLVSMAAVAVVFGVVLVIVAAAIVYWSSSSRDGSGDEWRRRDG
jgi:hypothetical protein